MGTKFVFSLNRQNLSAIDLIHKEVRREFHQEDVLLAMNIFFYIFYRYEYEDQRIEKSLSSQ